nr:MAG TPA: hypothetical protein [Bacteriophage sp.]
MLETNIIGLPLISGLIPGMSSITILTSDST